MSIRLGSILLAIGSRFSPILTCMRAIKSNARPEFRRIVGRLNVVMLAAMSLAQAQELPRKGTPSSLRVHGSATLSVMPDQAQFDIGVMTQGSTAKAASDQNAQQSNALVRE